MHRFNLGHVCRLFTTGNSRYLRWYVRYYRYIRYRVLNRHIHYIIYCGLLQEGGHELKLPAPKFVTASGKGDSTDGAVAPMPGVVEKVHVEPGQSVDKGDPLVVMIAMKMEVRGNLGLCYLVI